MHQQNTALQSKHKQHIIVINRTKNNKQFNQKQQYTTSQEHIVQTTKYNITKEQNISIKKRTK
jgi:hypothetical protein